MNIVDFDKFHDFYPARAHVSWVTQLPVLLAVQLGVVDLKLLATIQSAALFALPAALYHLALARLRGEGLLLAIVLAIVARRSPSPTSRSSHHRQYNLRLRRSDSLKWRTWSRRRREAGETV